MTAHANPGTSMPITEDTLPISELIKSDLEREQTSRQYQLQLESRIRQDHTAHLRIQEYCDSLNQLRVKHEQKLSQLIESERCLSQTVSLQQRKMEDLRLRLEHQHTINKTLLHILAQNGPSNIEGMLLKNEWQQKTISTLRSTLQVRDDTVDRLKAKLEELYQLGYSGCYCEQFGCASECSEIECEQSLSDEIDKGDSGSGATVVGELGGK